VEQSSVLPHPSGTDVAQVLVVAQVSGVQVQTPDLHGPWLQSVSAAHFWPATHFGQRVPPQSTSVSEPFFDLSVHEGSGVHAEPFFE
jgi:hypothetical protein